MRLKATQAGYLLFKAHFRFAHGYAQVPISGIWLLGSVFSVLPMQLIGRILLIVSG